MSHSTWLAIGVVVLVAAAQVRAQVVLKRTPTTMETKTFDPKHLPNPGLPIRPPEAACCVSDVECNVELDATTTEEGPVAGAGSSRTKITKVQATLAQKIVIWLPKNASSDLKAHEQGHQVIAQRVYDKADEPVGKLLQSYLGKTFEGDGASALNAASAEISNACIKLIGDEAGGVSAIFDEITNHSLKKEPPATKAVELSFERYAKEQARKR